MPKQAGRTFDEEFFSYLPWQQVCAVWVYERYEVAASQNLNDMKLTELKELAKQMGLRGTSTMRKPDLVATLEAARNGGEPPEGVTVGEVRRGRKPKIKVEETEAKEEQASPAPEAIAPAPAAPASEADVPADQLATATTPVIEPTPATPAAATAPAAEHEQPVRKSRVIKVVKGDAPAAVSKQTKLDLGLDLPVRSASAGADQPAKAKTPDIDLFDALNIELPRRRRRGADRDEAASGRDRIQRDDTPRGADRADRQDRSEHVRDLNDILAALPDRNNDDSAKRGPRSDRDVNERDFGRRDRSNRDRQGRDDRNNDRRDRQDRNDRRDRLNRADRLDRGPRVDRDVNDRNGGRRERDLDEQMREEPQGSSAVPIAGIVDVLESYAFVRTSGYLPGPNDVYVSMGQVKKYGLRKGDAVQGTIRPPRDGDRRNQRQKFVPLQSIESINGMGVDEARNRPEFSKLTPLYPQERLRMETEPQKIMGRLIDIVSPIGKGQRGLIVSPPKAGKTVTLQQIANSITTNNPEVLLMVVLVDERPEEVTDMERTVQGEVISSTFDRPASDHTIVAELAIERAKRMVELGHDVVVLLDSMTRLARAYNIAAPASGRILSGGVDAQALYPPKKFFGAARNIENGGSLTIISSALVETGSKMDEVIFEEFKGTGNMELRLSRDLADKRMFPAIDINASGTRREELITPPSELAVVYRLRRLLGGMEPEQAYSTLVPRLKKTRSNHEFLSSIAAQTAAQAQQKNNGI